MRKIRLFAKETWRGWQDARSAALIVGIVILMDAFAKLVA
jgi:hypothetical protein